MAGIAEEEDRTIAADNLPKKRHNVEELEGERISDRYIVTKRVGKGGMGVVYLAEHVTLKRNVCIKVLNPALIDDESALERFEREARSLSRLQHPNIVNIFDFGRDNDLAYIVMEYAQGETLSKFLKKNGALHCDIFLPIAIQILKGIGEAHKLQMIHRDIKPANIILSELEGEKNFVKILDFGLAKLAQGQEDVTKEQQLVGSASYMAPEQIIKGVSNPRTDVYALGIMFYQMLAGVKPFVGTNDNVILYKHVNETPAPLFERLNPDQEVPESLCQVIEQAMSKDPAKRPQDALAFLSAISIALDAPQICAGYSSMSLGKVDLQKLSEECETHAFDPATRSAAGTSTPGAPPIPRPSGQSFTPVPVPSGQFTPVPRPSGQGFTAIPMQSGAAFAQGSDNTNTYSGVTSASGIQLLQASDVLEVMARQDRLKDKRFFIMIVSVLVIVVVFIVIFLAVYKSSGNGNNAPTVAQAASEIDIAKYVETIEENLKTGDLQTASELLEKLKSSNTAINPDIDPKIAKLTTQIDIAKLMAKAERQSDTPKEAKATYEEILNIQKDNTEALKKIQEIDEKLSKVGNANFTYNPSSDIKVFVDNELLSEPPQSMELPVGSHNVRVVANGYEELEKTINIKAGDDIPIHFELNKLPEAPAPSARPTKPSAEPQTHAPATHKSSANDNLLLPTSKKAKTNSTKKSPSGSLLLKNK